MNVLILGSGGREHALARACARSPMIGRLLVAPGNPGCARVAEIHPVDLGDHGQIVALCRQNAIDLVVVGPEAPLVAGIADALEKEGVACFGPSREASRLEGSKGFAKDFCREFGIPTADYRRFRSRADAKAYVRDRGAPIVVKADGLAAGKGVIVAQTIEEAERAVDALLPETAFPAAEAVVEEFLDGEEVSFFALCDGAVAAPFASAQDHKRVGEGDTGPNTGGMGAYSPSSLMTPQMTDRVMREIVTPTVRGMAARGTPFRGVLFAGLMIGKDGPKTRRIQCPIRRPGDRGHSRAPVRRPLALARRLRVGSVAGRFADISRRSGIDGRHGRAGLSRGAPQGNANPRNRGGRARSRRRRSAGRNQTGG